MWINRQRSRPEDFDVQQQLVLPESNAPTARSVIVRFVRVASRMNSCLRPSSIYSSYEAGQPSSGRATRWISSPRWCTGVASLTQTMEDGRTQMVGLLLPSDFLGRPNRESRRPMT
jgi:hypothetical protein